VAHRRSSSALACMISVISRQLWRSLSRDRYRLTCLYDVLHARVWQRNVSRCAHLKRRQPCIFTKTSGFGCFLFVPCRQHSRPSFPCSSTCSIPQPLSPQPRRLLCITPSKYRTPSLRQLCLLFASPALPSRVHPHLFTRAAPPCAGGESPCPAPPSLTPCPLAAQP